MLEKQHRLRSSTRIKELRIRGRAWSNRRFVVIILGNGGQNSRFAFAVSRKIGGAVVRNRIRRLLRESVRHHCSSVEGGWDILFIARPLAKGSRFEEVDHSVRDLLKRAHLQAEAAAPSPSSGADSGDAPISGGSADEHPGPTQEM